MTERLFRLDEWAEHDGDVLWWKFPLSEPPYVGSPLDLGQTLEIEVRQHAKGPQLMSVQSGGWPGYHTHWTRLPVPPTAPTAGQE